MILLSKPFKCGQKQLKKGQMSFFVFVLMCISDQWKGGRGKSILSVKGELDLGISRRLANFSKTPLMDHLRTWGDRGRGKVTPNASQSAAKKIRHMADFFKKFAYGQFQKHHYTSTHFKGFPANYTQHSTRLEFEPQQCH